MLALIVFDGDFDLPQYALVYLADRRAEGGHGLRRIEVKDTEEIFMGKVFVRLQPAAGHEGVGDADGGAVSESNSYVEIIIFFQKGIVNDVEDVKLMLHPILIGHLRGDAFKLIGKAVCAGNVIAALQRGCYAA